MKKFKGLSTIWVVLISVGATIVIVGIIALIIWSTSQVKKASEIIASNSPGTSNTTKTSTPQVKTPSEEPTQVAENFLKSIFDTFPGSSVDLTKAKNYLSSSFSSKVNDTKESYWDLHGYIHSGPCRIKVEQVDKTSTTATVRISAEWGFTCNITDMQPNYLYKLTNDNGQWKISEIIQLNPDTEGQENVPRDF